MRTILDRYPSILRVSLSLGIAATTMAAQQPEVPAPAAPPAARQDVQQPPPPRFRTEANYVRVDAYPTRDGKPVMDLRSEEFEVFENGTRQQIQAFEHVVMSPAGPQSMLVEPNSVRQGEAMAANPRNRVFVFFLDVPHVSIEGSHHIKEPLIRLIDRILGPDDLVAVMTPEMSAAQITFGRKTAVIADMLRDKWHWGKRHTTMPMDAREIEYDRCYPPSAVQASAGNPMSSVARKMIARRRERMALDSLHDLAKYLGGVREERKAIVAVTDGWLLYRPDPSLTQLGPREPVPGTPPIGTDEWGRLRINPPRREPGTVNTDQTVCDRERMYLAAIDNEDYFRYLLDVANRNNASFYPVDPRGLSAFDYPMGPEPPPSMLLDAAHLTQRLQTLRTLAENTDGLAIVNSNDLDRGLRRIADDLNSYYLIGYYSTNARLDGQYRTINVKVKRPGVQVRARRGYRAPTAEEVNASRATAAAPVPETVKATTRALTTLSRIRPDQRFSVHAAPVRDAAGQVTALWVAGELHGAPQEFANGGTAAIEIAGGARTEAASATLKAGERAFLVKIPVQGNAAANVRAKLTASTGGVPLLEGLQVDLQNTAPQPLLFRRGLSTGNRLQPAAGFQFSRTDRLRLELPISADATPGGGRVLDRNNQPLQLPVQIAERKDDEGQRWLMADATLSALGAGDYVVEVTYTAGGSEQRVLTAIRVTR